MSPTTADPIGLRPAGHALPRATPTRLSHGQERGRWKARSRAQLNEYARSVIRNKARQLIGKYGFTPDDYEDLEQEMILDLLVRLPKFDPEQGVPQHVRRADRGPEGLHPHPAPRAGEAGPPPGGLVPGRADRGRMAGATGARLLGQDDVDLRTRKHDRAESDARASPGSWTCASELRPTEAWRSFSSPTP